MVPGRGIFGGAVVAVVVALAFPSTAAPSARVAALQVALKRLHLYAGIVDGVRGPQTRQAVLTFQTRRGLVVDGVVGPQTRAALGKRGGPRLGSRIMHRGDRGWDVAALQYLLAKRGFPPGAIDAVFGPITQTAVQNFQRSAFIGIDGLAGSATIGALRRRTSAPTTTPVGGLRLIHPVAGPLGDGFGAPRDGGSRRHMGQDFEAGFGARVGAAAPGVTEFVGANQGGYGNLVVVRHQLGYTTWYAHLSTITTWVGEQLSAGTRIGLVGATGNATGPHLHFELRRFGVALDPAPYLVRVVAAGRRGGGVRARSCPTRAPLVNYRLARIDSCRAVRGR